MPSFALWTNSLSSSKPRLGVCEYNLALDFFCHWIGNYEKRLIYSVKTAKHLLTFTNNTWFHPQQVIWDVICARASVYLVCNTIMSCVDKKTVCFLTLYLYLPFDETMFVLSLFRSGVPTTDDQTASANEW